MMIAVNAIGEMSRIALDVAGPAARTVDRDARFPHETVDALRVSGLLAAPIPNEQGGLGLGLADLVEMIMLLAERCGSSAMIFAMHCSQLFCLVEHAHRQDYFIKFLSACAKRGLLVASSTSEVGTGGNIFESVAPVEEQQGCCTLRKECTVLSYGREADAILVTMRRSTNSRSSDQVIALLEREQVGLEPRGHWDTMGMRGTCSPPVILTAEFAVEQFLAANAREILKATMVPVTHILWAAVWTGIARGAVATATAFLQVKARTQPSGSSLSGARLARCTAELRALEDSVTSAAFRRQERNLSGDSHDYVRMTLDANALKLSSSTSANEVCRECLLVCGVAGYGETSRFSVSRAIRDLMSAPLMINNDLIAEANGAFLSL